LKNEVYDCMIRTLRGKILSKVPPQAVVEVGGLGYGIFAPFDAFEIFKLNEEVFLFTYHHITEDRQQLYGFLTVDQRDFFELLLTVSGVGPKSALSVVSSNTTDVLRSAIAEGGGDIFASIAGIGKKTAERIIVDLKSKIGIQPGMSSSYGDTYEALRALGFGPAEVRQALAGLPPQTKDTQEQIKLALKALAKR